MSKDKIPKVIHYCWFGGNEIPEKLKKYMSTWKELMPDYEILEWNESNSDISANTYVKEAYAHKKYAFVSDYVRLRVLYEHGGIYLDTDVEVLKSFDDLLEKGAFIGTENNLIVGPDTMGTIKGNGLIKRVLEDYETRIFVKDDGSYDYRAISSYMTEFFKEDGYRVRGGYQHVAGFHIFPPEYFHPLDFWSKKLLITENSYSIHWWSESWKSFPERMKTQFHRIVGNKVMKRLSVIKRFIIARKS